jgi:hypothetical protein
MSGRGSEAPPKYVLQEWGKNCVMQALSKVMGRNIHELGRYIVDNNIGGVTMIKQIENGSVIKKVLAGLGFRSLHEGGLSWAKMRPLVLNYGTLRDSRGDLVEEFVGTTSYGKPLTSHYTSRKFYAVYWRRKQKEDWTDKEVQPGAADHAFTLIVNGPTIFIPPTNDTDFDTSHNPLKDDDFISVFMLP